MGRNKNLAIVDYGNRYEGYADAIRNAAICGRYDLRGSILSSGEDRIVSGGADFVFYLDQMQQEFHPSERMCELSECLKEDGLLVINTRAESGFEVLEITTPGVMDVKYVLDSCESFVGYLLEESSLSMLQEFQRFLQKACLSCFVRVIASPWSGGP